MKQINFALVVVGIVLITACSSSSTPKTPSPLTDDEIADLSGNAVVCAKDTDCIVIEIGCCDHCNGGEVIAVNEAYEELLREYHTQDCGEQTACTMMSCPAELPRCRNGTCEHYTDTSDLF